MKRNALIFGATGLTGKELSLQLIHSDYYNSVNVAGRSALELEHPRLRSYLVELDHLEHFKPDCIIHDVYICLGTTLKKAGSKAAFRKVDYEYVMKIGNWAKEQEIQRVAVISSMGTSPSTRNFYLKTKAEMEAGLVAINLPALVILRPSILLGKRTEFRFLEMISQVVMRAFSSLMTGRLARYRGVEATKLARAMFKALINATEGVTIVENESIGLYQ
ncbi:MAG: hypothetical protein JW801_07510 [Bacteroidales bacterium]|nr:hypothetical protein [Bacteroidales bacterium]